VSKIALRCVHKQWRKRGNAAELAQHTPSDEEPLSDPLNRFKESLVATIGTEIVGLDIMTLAGNPGDPVDSFSCRSVLAIRFDAALL
jgi:hypothetical protein